ncbi:MAG: T9SS type A sorting domain-containing protein [Bacteroidota bacterium]|nr:T9SS type A sorting domain-containing protein [Bacteroidota bacterium]
MMKRRFLLKGIGTLGLTSMLPASAFARSAWAASRDRGAPLREFAACWLTPASTEGPYYFDIGELRMDIRRDSKSDVLHDGIPLTLTMRIVNADCQPVAGVLVDIWHANREGLYSGYVQPHGDTVGEDFLRGTQVTDPQGECRFVTSYPGWYPGRATHIHFKVRLSSMSYVTSQFAFEDRVNTAVYDTALYSARGQNPTSNAADGVFRDATPEHLLLTVTEDAATGGYAGTFTIGIDTPTAVEDAPRPGQVWLGENYPNPFAANTMLPFSLPSSRHVELSVFDAAGREQVQLLDAEMSVGRHDVPFQVGDLPSGYYFYRLRAGEDVRMREMLLLR